MIILQSILTTTLLILTAISYLIIEKKMISTQEIFQNDFLKTSKQHLKNIRKEDE
jgi:hypothetical protein